MSKTSFQRVLSHENVVQHTYFLDKESAVAEYELAKHVTYDNGEVLRQFCYYRGSDDEPMVNADTPYLVNLPPSKTVTFFLEYLAYPVPTRVNVVSILSEKEAEQTIEELLAIFLEIEDSKKKKVDDALFTQPVMAEWMAKQHIKMYRFHPHIHAIQMCYVIGNSPEGGNNLKNLVYLPEDEMAQVLVEKGGRYPKIVVNSPFDSPELISQGKQFLAYIQKTFQEYQKSYTNQLVKLCYSWQPYWRQKPWRVLMPRFRYRKLLGDAQEKMAQAFKALGLEVCLIEVTPYSTFSNTLFAQYFATCRPHFTFNIDTLILSYFNEQVYHVVWWHDLGPEHKTSKHMFAQPHTQHYVVEEMLFDAARHAGAQFIEYQPLCVDEDVFYPPAPEMKRREVIAFVGMCYQKQVVDFKGKYGQDALDGVLSFYRELFYNEQDTPEERLGCVKAYVDQFKSTYSEGDLIFLWSHVNRVEILHALIASGEIEVEVYGTDWLDDPVVAPYCKGYIEPGTDLANLYRDVKYVLSVQPYMVGHQRLGEIALCGAIPLVHWTPNRIEKIDYQDEIMTFTSPQDLLEKLKQLPSDPLGHEKIRAHFSYHAFAERVVAEIEAQVKQAQRGV